jgi:hypothetical protein
MTRPAATLSPRSGSDSATVVQAVTVIMGVVVGLTFLFGFGNVRDWIGKALLLVKTVRSEFQTRGTSRELSDDRTPVSVGSATTLAVW